MEATFVKNISKKVFNLMRDFKNSIFCGVIVGTKAQRKAAEEAKHYANYSLKASIYN